MKFRTDVLNFFYLYKELCDREAMSTSTSFYTEARKYVELSARTISLATNVWFINKADIVKGKLATIKGLKW